MASVNPHTRELVFKLVFYGPGLGGKTTTLQYIHAATKPEHRGKMVSLATPTDRTLYFDFLPIRIPRVRGMAVRLQLFTVPGQVYYAATRKLVLSGADGVVFVADSQSGRVDTNQEALEDLHANLAEHNRSLEDVPHTFHWNKRDLTELMTIEELDRRFNAYRAPSLGTVATKGEGVFEGLERIARLVLKAYEKDPKVRIEATENGSEPRIEEEGVAHALRQMEGSTPIDPPTKISQLLPEFGRPPMVIPAVAEQPKSLRRESKGEVDVIVSRPSTEVSLTASDPPQGRAAQEASGWTKAASVETPPERSGSAPADRPGSAPADRLGSSPADRPGSSPAERPGSSPVPGSKVTPSSQGGSVGFSLAELWPDAERDRVRQAEAMLGARDAVNAILACDVLVTRVLASAAGLVSTLDAPRDPALVSLLLGLEGTRYLHFRALVRAARHREAVTMRDALECFSFSLEARRARDAIKR